MTAGPHDPNPWAKFNRRVLLAPSLLACDFMRMGEQVAAVHAAGAEVLHVDMMDGHFVPNLSMSPGMVSSVRAHSDPMLDVHLMVTDPLNFVEPFAQAGASSVTFHVEANGPARPSTGCGGWAWASAWWSSPRRRPRPWRRTPAWWTWCW